MASSNNDKIIELIGQMSVMDLAKLVKELEEAFGVSAAAMAAPVQAAASTGAAPEAAEEKSEYKVTLKTGGDKTIETIKALRKVTPLGLTEAKEAVVNAPTVIADAVSKDEARKMKETLEAAGATVELS